MQASQLVLEILRDNNPHRRAFEDFEALDEIVSIGWLLEFLLVAVWGLELVLLLEFVLLEELPLLWLALRSVKTGLAWPSHRDSLMSNRSGGGCWFGLFFLFFLDNGGWTGWQGQPPG